jgi:superfamily II DNA or RNA helicase
MKDSLTVLASLKPFQKRTVEFVYRRMYEDSSPAMKFLIADEVGLGKTLVAKGIIVKAIEKMQRDGKIGRIDIVYVCSNAAIARQNINRLNVSGEKGFAIA